MIHVSERRWSLSKATALGSRYGAIMGIAVAVFAPITVFAAEGGGTPMFTQDSLSTGRAASSQSPGRPSSARVTLAVANSPIAYVVQVIAKQAGLKVVYNRDNRRMTHRVSLKVANVPAMDAVALALKNTGLSAKLAADGETLMIGVVPTQGSSSRESSDSGAIQGNIVDSATGNPVSGATVTIVERAISATSNDGGAFILTGVPDGTYTVSVKLVGYRVRAKTVTVAQGKSVSMQIRLSTMPTQLSGVVTTVTGQQRKVEVGNDITTINVGEVIQKYPVSTMTDLLSTRVPGLYAAPMSGQPGAPTRIRIRGVSSLSASNDPIIVVDGVQVRSGEGELKKGYGVGFVFSSLNQIDPNAVETIEILKGPSAVALYGSDAANGVIVVTTKRGQAGPPVWTASGSWRAETMPGTWPKNYYGWGHVQQNAPTQCKHAAWTAGGCTYDSLTVYQILNDPTTTVFGRGLDQAYSTNVSGGTRAITYSLTMSTRQVLGLVKLPDADAELLRAAGENVPAWQRRPQAMEMQSGTATVGIEAGSATRITVATTVTRQAARDTPLSGAIGTSAKLRPAKAIYGSDGTLLPIGSGLLPEISDFRQKKSQNDLRSQNTLAVRMNGPHGTVLTTNLGLDVTASGFLQALANGDCVKPWIKYCADDGSWNTGQGSSVASNLKLNISAPLLQLPGLQVKTSVGGDYVRGRSQLLHTNASGLAVGATSGSQATSKDFREGRSEQITAGMYMEVQVGIANRFWFPLAIRTDAGSTLGGGVYPKFPKLGFSYLVSDQPLYQRIPVLKSISDLRIRAAYGVAGKQPDMTAKLRTYTQVPVLADGQQITTMNFNSIGNYELRPEQTQEMEWGFESGLLEGQRGRVGISATWSRKHTTDLLVVTPLPASLGDLLVQTTNLGDVDNTTFELNLDALLNTHFVSWRPMVGLTHGRNTLVRLGHNGNARGSNVNGTGLGDAFFRNVIGFPILSRWAKPIVGYADRDHSGFIEADEVIYADSAVFIGAPYPKYMLNVTNELTFFSRLSVNGILSYESGLTQIQQESLYDRVSNDQTTSLREQAYGLYSDLTRIQSVSTLRFSSVQVTYIVPHRFTQRLTRNRTLTIAIQGTNVGLWSTYRGKDPNVGAAGDVVEDAGLLPTPRAWGFSLRIN